MKIYISGKISGLPFTEVVDKFGFHQRLLKIKGYEPVNPLVVSPFDSKKQWSDYMVDDIAALIKCDAIYMLKDWGQSRGARVEYLIAKELGLKVFFDGEFNEDF